jgi:hypothetical protein
VGSELKLYHVHLALPQWKGEEWLLPPMELADADDAVKAAKRGGLRAWRTEAPEYNLEPTQTAASDTMTPEAPS